MSFLFRLTLLVTALSATIGYGSLFFAASLGPSFRRLDPADHLAVAQASYRAGARRNETALFAVGPALVAATAASDGRVAWSAAWLWTALAVWAATLLIRGVLIQPARRAGLVIAGELAGAGPSEVDIKRTTLGALARRAQLGSLLTVVLYGLALTVVVFRAAR